MQENIGQRSGLSDVDALRANLLYKSEWAGKNYIKQSCPVEMTFLPHLISFSFSDWPRTVGDESPYHGSRHECLSQMLLACDQFIVDSHHVKKTLW